MRNNTNLYAPEFLNGVNPSAPAGFVDMAFDYVFNQVLTASQVLRDLRVDVHTDADFIWRGIVYTSTGAFQIRFSDAQGYYLSNSMVNYLNLSGQAGTPTPVFPELFFPAGGRLMVDIDDLSVAGNTVQVLLRGCKRYRLPNV